MIGTLDRVPAVFMTARGGEQMLADHFLSRFADAYLAEMRDFVQTMLTDREPRVTGDDGLKALAIAVAAEESQKRSLPIAVEHEPTCSTS
jgi:myo-inositol 2-dehydrogenase/D-chiro-inositol 1-dehydrogenase